MADQPKRSFGPRFSLRSLLLVMLIAGPLGGFGWTKWQAWKEWRIQEASKRLQEKQRGAVLSELQAIQKAQLAVGGGTAQLSGERYRKVREMLEGPPIGEATPDPPGTPIP